MSSLQENTLRESLLLMQHQASNIEGVVKDLYMIVNCSVLAVECKSELSSILANLEKEIVSVSADVVNSLETLRD